jgi:hypothetical protein|tara:strand:- start:858 stop:2546 length:1689 start_codon:yes stop_codon:yes gene_type:complete
MARNKPIPRSQRNDFNRGTKISRNSPGAKDDVKNLSVGIMDMDSAIMYYFNEVIKPSVEINDENVKVPCIYASPERWTQVSKQGFLRDKKRQIIVPLIVFKRTGMSRNDDMPIDKLDANNPIINYSFQKKYSQQNRFDKFSVLKNIEPNREYYNVAMPDYMTITYEFIVWTSYIEQMNRIVEKINFSDGAYWGEPGKMKFRTKIDSFSDSSQIEGERLIKTTFSMTLNGYILPETFNNYTTTQKYLTPKKLIIRESTDKTIINDKGEVQDLSSNAAEFGEATKEVFSISITNPFILEQGTGVTLSNNGQSFDGSAPLTQEISIGQDVATDADVQFNTLTANQLNIGTGTTKFTDGGISGSVAITGSFVTSQSATIEGDLTVTGSLTSDLFIQQITTRSVDFSAGSNQFGDSLDDKHEFTGSADITGSFILNGTTINEISNDSTFADESPTALVTEEAIANFNVATLTTDETTYLRKQFYKTSSGIVSTNTASFTATTASAPSGVTATSINDFVFFINGQYMEHDALSINQSGSVFNLQVNTTSIGYELESDDEILAIGKFDS